MGTMICSAFVKHGFGYGRKHCARPASFWHPMHGELCQECASQLKAIGVKGIKPLK